MLQAFLTLIPVFVTPLFAVYVIGLLTRASSKAAVYGIAAGATYGVLALCDRDADGLAAVTPAMLEILGGLFKPEVLEGIKDAYVEGIEDGGLLTA